MKFTTSQGSSYDFFPSTCTSIRFKRSGGSGQGELYCQMNVFFVDRKVPLYNPTYQCIPGYIDKGNGTFHPYHPQSNMLVIKRRETGEIVGYLPTSKTPKIGLRPFEWVKAESGYEKHLGNEIVTIGE